MINLHVCVCGRMQKLFNVSFYVIHYLISIVDMLKVKTSSLIIKGFF